jgi:hypothetical protein
MRKAHNSGKRGLVQFKRPNSCKQSYKRKARKAERLWNKDSRNWEMNPRHRCSVGWDIL